MHEKTISSRTVFDGRLLKLDVVDVELDGGRLAVREVVRHPGAAVVLVQQAEGCFVFVRQFRKAVERTLLEAVAGTLDPGEDAPACAAREVAEETGYRATDIRPLGEIYPAPGYTSERLHVFFARTRGEPATERPDEDESLQRVTLSRDEFETMIANGEVHDAKTLAAWHLYLARGAIAEQTA